MILILLLLKDIVCIEKLKTSNEIKKNELYEHTMVTDNNIFPYIAAILKKSTYLSAGALINENWVLTAADALFLLRESARILRVRIGSINYKEGGLLLPIKYFQIHPYFDDKSPIYDLALVRLPYSLRFTPSLQAIRLQEQVEEIDAAHLIVTSWPFPITYSEESLQVKSMEMIKRQRLLSVTHLHPSHTEECEEELLSLGIKDSTSILCLDSNLQMEPCTRNVGAPVVFSDVLWGIVSSWKPINCENDLAGSTFVNLVSAVNISTWIYSTIGGHSREE